MKTTRSAAARMHSFRLTLVRRSSSMMPTFRVSRGKAIMSSTRSNSSFKGHLVRSVHLRLHHIHRAGSTVALGIRARDIAQRNERGHRCVEYALRYLVVGG